MEKYEKIAWRLSIVYIVFVLIFFIVKMVSSQKVEHSYFSHLLLFGIFYMTFKKKKVVFSAASFGWLLIGAFRSIYRLFLWIPFAQKDDGFISFMAGAVVTLGFMMLMAYFACRVLIEQVVACRRMSNHRNINNKT